MRPALAPVALDARFDLASYDYDLPPELIAQKPLPERDAARLLVLEQRTGMVQHRHVRDLPGLLRAGDVVVINDTRVRPARFRAATETGARVELLFVAESGGVWQCLGRPLKRLRPGRRLWLPDGSEARVARVTAGGVEIEPAPGLDINGFLERCGEMPLPPYIRRPQGLDPADRERYQTVYARAPGAIAAPTAGLHLTDALLARLGQTGVEVAALTLHVGPGTFLPVREGDVRGHEMQPEWAEIPEATVQAITAAKREGRRVVAVGTTTTRALESRAAADGSLRAGAGWADAFILPGGVFRVVDGLVTNFHLPCSTLLMLVCALAGRDAVLAAYREAVRQRYRFYSYGDATLVV